MNNERVTLPALIAPLREVGVERCRKSTAPFVLLVHDWSKLAFDDDKADLVQLTHATDVGYELTTALLVSADDGAPLAPMEMHLRTAEGMLGTRSLAPRVRGHLEQVPPTMRAARTWGLERPILHVIDREADSVDHDRRWDAAAELFLVRADDRRVKWQENPALLSTIAKSLRARRRFTCCGTASYQGRAAQVWVAETEVVLHRPAKKSVRGRKYTKPGRPLALRLIVVQVRNGAGKVLAQWLLLTNAPPHISAPHLARCYY